MVQYFIRALLALALLVVGLNYVEQGKLLPEYRVYLILGALVLALTVITVDLVIPRKSLRTLGGLFFGLTVGLLVTYGLTFVIDQLVAAFAPVALPSLEGSDHPLVAITKVLVGIVCCYFCISFVMQTKDDVRFIIPYVEFAKQLKGQHPIILDTSVIIDGRIVDICETGIIDQKLIVPRFVLRELQAVADSNDKLKRVRGRRGLDVLNKLQTMKTIDIQVMDAGMLSKAEAAESVDLKLLSLAKEMNGRVATNDYNLNKIAKLRDVMVINVNDLANALKPIVLPGETLEVKVVKPGEEPGQGVGYLDDGTMIVVEQGRNNIGDVVTIAVTSVLQTSAGRMIFGRVDGAPRPAPRRTSQLRNT
jgi:uncharacterized protein YacL